MAYYVPSAVLGAIYMAVNKTKSLSSWSLCSNGHRAHKPFNIAEEPSAEQGVVPENAGEAGRSLFYG